MAPGLRALFHQERFYLDTLTNAKQFVEGYREAQHSGQLAGWKQRIDGLDDKFHANRLAIELSLDDDEDKSKSDKVTAKPEDAAAQAKDDADKDAAEESNRLIRKKFELDYVLVYSFLVNEIQKQTVAPQAEINPVSPGRSRVKLPDITLPMFNGSILEWITFRDSFKSLIHSNADLSPFDKFMYLVGSMTPKARERIDNIDVSAANYPLAWQALEDLFENKKLIFKAYMDVLFAIEPMRKECYESLAQLVDGFERNLNMIKKLDISTDGWGAVLGHMVCSRLDPSTLKQWESHYRSTDVPDYKELMAFLKGHLSVLQSLPTKSSSESHKQEQRPLKSKTVHAVTSPATGLCPFCSKSTHSAFKCEVFQGLPVPQRFDLVKKKNLCINCLSSEHMVRNCSSGTCRVNKCHQKHHTMLHLSADDRPTNPNKPVVSRSHPPLLENPSSSQSSPPLPSVSQPPSATSLVSTNSPGAPRVPATVLLQTAIVKVLDFHGHHQWARVLLDPASQLNLITENIVQKLKLRRYKCHQAIGGVGNSMVTSSHAVHVQIGSHCSDFKSVQSFHILKRITQDLPTRTFDPTSWKLPTNITLADPKFFEPSSIDLLLGMELYYDLLLDGFTKLGPEKPILQNTVFGWVASGKIGSGQAEGALKMAHVCSDQSLDQLLNRFWEVESCWSASTQSMEEVACEEHFVGNTYRDESGRFVVTLPKQPSVLNQLGDSKKIATRRFLALERRLNANPQLKQVYTNFIEEYHQLGHMREVEDVSSHPAGPSYYLPHHGVEKADSTTTKLRVVFDASCRTDSGVALNQALMVGSVVQDDLFAIHLRFRMNRIALIADIEKMYRQIRIHSSDYQLQRILWRNSSSEPLRTFELTTVTYGTASAPFLATRCLNELSKQGAEDYPLASLALGRDFYVDDMLTGVYDEEEGEELCKQLLSLLPSAGFSLRKWASNSAEVLSKIPPELRDERSVLGLESHTTPIKTLGIQWQPATDTYSYAVPIWSTQSVITRRVVASDLAKLFLPLGLLGPVIVLAKIFVQSLWEENKSWDAPLKPEQQQYWREYRNSLEDIPSISIPRWVACASDPVLVELHGYCDASERAYGTNIYIRTVSRDGTISVRLLCAKSKVAPSGKSKNSVLLSLPLLELSSALLLAHLYHKVAASLDLKTKPFFWTDSMIVLCYIRSPPARWKKFVANRVAEIQRLTAGGIWSHCPGAENPADIISRGMSPAELRDTPAWWISHEWLNRESRFWPPINQPLPDYLPGIAQAERAVALPVQEVKPNELFAIQSSFPLLLRLVAYLRRFQHNASSRDRNNRRIGHLTTLELTDATKILVRIAQREALSTGFNFG